jgi:hypothetical protein
MMRYHQILNEAPDPKLIDKAAAIMRRMSWQEDGFYTIKNVMYDDGYLESPDNVDHKSRAFTQKFIQWSKDEVIAKLDELTRLMKGGRMRIWREIIAPEDWTPDPKQHPGLYWSWDKEAAEAHWGDDDGVPWLLSATVTEDQIDWVQTVAQNATHHYQDEKEIRLKPNTPVTLDGYQRR